MSQIASHSIFFEVIASDIGGIPELIEEGVTGELFESGNKEDLKAKVLTMWQDKEKTASYSQNCKNISFDTVEEYCEKLMGIYGE